ncbi:MAG: hypothetical protein Q4G03_01590 [Planctomycetia bacterium]|nr:hypothetical protein [Planctomycetia bacterium]
MPTRKELVEQAIFFKNPTRVPLWVDGANIGLSDVLKYNLLLPDLNDPTLTEWGFRRMKRSNGSWVVPEEPVLATWQQVDAYHAPPLDVKRRFEFVEKAARVVGDRYRLASFGLSGYSIYRAMRGAKLSADDFLIETTRFLEFMELIFVFEANMFDHLARLGFHGIEFVDDWGPRGSSRMTLSLWQRILKDFYADQFKIAHNVGLHVWFTTTEESHDFFDDLRAIGANVIHVAHPEEVNVSQLGRLHRGRSCMSVDLDKLYSPEDLENSADQIRIVRECLGTLTGGFIGRLGANIAPEHIRVVYNILSGFKNL